MLHKRTTNMSTCGVVTLTSLVEQPSWQHIEYQEASNGWIAVLQYATLTLTAKTVSAFAATSSPTFGTTKPIFSIRQDRYSKSALICIRKGWDGGK